MDRWIAVGLSVAGYSIFLAVMFYYACCTNAFQHPKTYFKLLLLYRFLDLELNIALLWMALKYDEVKTDSIVANLIIIYSSVEIAVGIFQLLKAVFLLGRCYIHVREE